MDAQTPYDGKTLVQLARIGLIAVGIVATFLTVAVVYTVKKAPPDKNPMYTLLAWFERAVTLHMMAVILIVIATSFLGLFGVVKENGVVGILSGIGGYVLGGLKIRIRTPTINREDSNRSLTGSCKTFGTV